MNSKESNVNKTLVKKNINELIELLYQEISEKRERETARKNGRRAE